MDPRLASRSVPIVDIGRKILPFLVRQTHGAHKGGVRAIKRKSITLLGLLAGVPVVLLVRLIRPIVLIRFSGIKGERFGHATADAELYLCEREAGVQPKALDLFYYATPICNEQLKRMIERRIRVFRLASFVDRINRVIPGGSRHSIVVNGGVSEDESGTMARGPSHLGFTSKEENFGETELRKLGIPNEADFVCVHIRDSAYLSNAFPGFDSSYHDFRDSRAHNYLPAMQELTNLGYRTVRMGSAVNEPLSSVNPMIVDYATNHRTEFLDLYLFWKCCFYLGSSAGVWAVPAAFRKPIAYVNHPWLQIRTSTGPNDLLIPKKLWLRHDERYMSFREIFESGAGRFNQRKQYDDHGIELVENSSEEISDLASEMDQRLRGTWHSTDEDEELQTLFWSTCRPASPRENQFPRMGTQFLRENQALLA